jgi:hypothetical protein
VSHKLGDKAAALPRCRVPPPHWLNSGWRAATKPLEPRLGAIRGERGREGEKLASRLVGRIKGCAGLCYGAGVRKREYLPNKLENPVIAPNWPVSRCYSRTEAVSTAQFAADCAKRQEVKGREWCSTSSATRLAR